MYYFDLLVVTFLLVALMSAGILVAYFFLEKRDLQDYLTKKQQFIDEHLYVVNLNSKQYVFPYVWGTKKSLVFYTESNLQGEVLTRTLSPEEAKRRIEVVHLAHADEMDKLGI